MGSVVAGVAALLMAVIMPAVLLSPMEPAEDPSRLLVIEAELPAEADIFLSLQTGGGIEELPLEEYLIGVILSEMPMSFEQEALKAQAVAARTFAVRQMQGGKHEDFDLCDQSSCCQAWTGQAVLKEKLGDSRLQYWDKAEKAVMATEGLVMTYNGELIDAVYFSCSGGATEAAVAVWGGEVPYLQSVESPGEEGAGKFRSEVRYTLDEFCSVISSAQPSADLTGKAETWIGAAERSAGGGVEEIIIGGCSFRGTELRQLFELNSTSFDLSLQGNEMVFSVSGYGHRVGMSQYGANAMAKSGMTYEEILTHYYSGVEIRHRQ